MLSAAARGDLASIKLALKNANVNVCDTLKRTPLHIAASEGQLEVVEYLISCKADLNTEDHFKNTCLNDAIRHGHDEVAKLLRQRGASLVIPEKTAGRLMCKAAFKGDLPEIKRLIENGVSPNASDHDGRTAMHLAACQGHLSAVEFLLASNADVAHRDVFFNSPLEDAVRHGHSSIQRIIRGAGGFLDQATSAARMCEFAASGDVDSIKILIENGVDCCIGGPNQRTAMHLAASNKMINVLDYLYKHVSIVLILSIRYDLNKYFLMQVPNIEINPVDAMGRTPMEVSAF